MQTEVYRSDIHAEDVSQASPAIVWELPDVLADDFMPWRHPLLESLRQAEDRCFSPAFTCVLAPDGFVLTHVGDEVLEIGNSGLSGLAAPGSSLTLNYVTVGKSSSVWLNMGSSIEQADFKIYESEEVARILDAAGGYGITVYDANGMRVNVDETASVSQKEVNLYIAVGVIVLIIAGLGVYGLSKIELKKATEESFTESSSRPKGKSFVETSDGFEIAMQGDVYCSAYTGDETDPEKIQAELDQANLEQIQRFQVKGIIDGDGEGHEKDEGFAGLLGFQNDTLLQNDQVIKSDDLSLKAFKGFVSTSNIFKSMPK